MTDYKLVPFEPTPEMIVAAEEAHMPFGDMELAIRMAILAAPAVQEEPVAWYLPGEGGCDSQFRDHATVKSCTGNPWAGWQPLYAAPVAPWIPVSERLPKPYEEVRFYPEIATEPIIDRGYFDNEVRCWYNECTYGGIETVRHERTTHWQPITVPKEQSDE